MWKDREVKFLPTLTEGENLTFETVTRCNFPVPVCAEPSLSCSSLDQSSTLRAPVPVLCTYHVSV